MRLLLDEQYSPEIARELKRRGHDAEAIKDRRELQAMEDPELLRRAQRELRVLVTDNVVDFAPLIGLFAELGEHHSGVLFTSGNAFPRSEEGIGLQRLRLRRVASHRQLTGHQAPRDVSAPKSGRRRCECGSANDHQRRLHPRSGTAAA